MRALEILYRDVWQRRLPNGLISPRYLWTNDKRIKTHRTIWWQAQTGWRKLPYLLIQLWLWLKWVFFFGWLAIYQTLKVHSKQIQRNHGLSNLTQLRRLATISVGCCIPPRDAISFGLIIEPQKRWDFVYDHEVQAYHAWANRALAITRRSQHLISDKLEQTRLLEPQGVPMAPILACVAKGNKADLFKWLDKHKALFCKTRSGNRGLGAFKCWQDGNGVAGQTFEGQELHSDKAVIEAWQNLLKRDDALIQPALQNHPDLALLSHNEDAITVRYISMRSGDGTTCLCATLEIPAAKAEKSGAISYVILPIDPSSGKIKPFPENKLALPKTRKHHDGLVAKLAPEQTVPGWPELVSASHRAHLQFPDIWAIAWDWVPTEDGPKLLEGNAGWGTTTPQLLHGGFINRL